ncbi:MAG TPA: nucleotide exchange factor GrpE [Syntrophorhabdales bacterium]|nr:nucleotide exchange factor GrpE [Syntrophorhabdales bacterium]
MQNDGNGKKIEEEAPAHEEKVSEAHEEHKKKKKKEEILEELKQKLEEKEKEAGELKERLLYQQADFENFKKLKAKEKQEALKFGNETLVKDLLPVIDNLERAIQHGCKSEDSKAIVEGVELTLNSFLKVLEKFGVTRVDALEREFDPNVHEAIAQEAREDKAPGTVVTELQKGYIMDGRLLRPSMVTVAKSSEKE